MRRTWDGNRFSTYTSEELSTLRLIESMGDQLNHNTDEIPRLENDYNNKLKEKTNLTGDHKGSWHGIEKPQFAEPGIAGVVDKLVSQMDDIVNKKLKMQVNIEEYRKLVTNEGKPNECWSNAFKTAINDLSLGGTLNLNGETYNFQDGFDFSDGVNIKGIRSKTILKLNTVNKTLINMFDNCFLSTLENITLQGLGKVASGQVGIDLKGWNTTINNCVIKDFDIGIDCKGVLINIEKCYIHNNLKGVDIKQLEQGVFSTMINIKDSLIHYNNDGIFANDNDDVNAQRPMISFNLENTALEHNVFAFRIPATINGKIQNCWFEGNTNRPQTHKSGWILDNNRYETDNQKIEYLSREYQSQNFGGITEISDVEIATKEIKLSEFGTNLLPIHEKNIKLTNGNLQFDDENILTSQLNKSYQLLVKKGDIGVNTLPENSISFIKNGIGDYTFKMLNTLHFKNPIIQVTFVNDDGGTEITGTTILKFKDQATYIDWFSVDEIDLKCYRKDNNELIDGRVMINILCDGIYN